MMLLNKPLLTIFIPSIKRRYLAILLGLIVFVINTLYGVYFHGVMVPMHPGHFCDSGLPEAWPNILAWSSFFGGGAWFIGWVIERTLWFVEQVAKKWVKEPSSNNARKRINRLRFVVLGYYG